MDEDLRSLLESAKLLKYRESFEMNNILNLRTLQLLKDNFLLLNKVIAPVGDVAILLAHLESCTNVQKPSSESDLLRGISTPSCSSQASRSATASPAVLWEVDSEGTVLRKSDISILPPTPDNTEAVSTNDSTKTPNEQTSKRKGEVTPAVKSSRVRKWLGSQEVEKIDLQEVLNSCSKGRTVLQYYRKNKVLSSQCRTQLVKIIGDKLLDITTTPTGADYQTIDEKIRQLFTVEKEFVYFIGSKTNGQHQRNHEGKLPNYVRNTKHRNTQLLNSGDVLSSDDEEGISELELEDTEEDLNADGWLKSNLEPWEEVKKYWKVTSGLRFRKLLATDNANGTTLVQYFKEYEVLRLSQGFKLLEIDFELRYPASSNALKDNWNLKKSALRNLLEIELKSDDHKEALGRFKNLTEDQQDNFILLAIRDLFPHQPRRRGGKRNEVQPRPSLTDSKEGFIHHVFTPNDIEPSIIRRLNQMKKGGTIQPFVICVGPTQETLTRSYCCVDTIKYEFVKLKDAFDVCFKAIFALHTDYSPEAYQSWLFVQQAFYGITTEFDKKSPQVSAMVGNFEALLTAREEQ